MVSNYRRYSGRLSPRSSPNSSGLLFLSVPIAGVAALGSILGQRLRRSWPDDGGSRRTAPTDGV